MRIVRLPRSLLFAVAMFMMVSCGGGAGITADDAGEPAGDNVAGVAETGAVTPQGTGVTGAVTGASGEPVGVANISAVGDDRSTQGEPVPQEANVTDAEGRFFIPLRPGRWRITVRAHGYRSTTVPVVVTEDDPTVQDVVLSPDSD